jgi:hypothetical protein
VTVLEDRRLRACPVEQLRAAAEPLLPRLERPQCARERIVGAVEERLVLIARDVTGLFDLGCRIACLGGSEQRAADQCPAPGGIGLISVAFR